MSTIRQLGAPSARIGSCPSHATVQVSRRVHPHTAGADVTLDAPARRAGQSLESVPQPDRTGCVHAVSQVLKGIADALDMSAETLYREAGLLDDSVERPGLERRGCHPSGRSAHPGGKAGVDPGLPRLGRDAAAIDGEPEAVAPRSQAGGQGGAGKIQAEVPLNGRRHPVGELRGYPSPRLSDSSPLRDLEHAAIGVPRIGP